MKRILRSYTFKNISFLINMTSHFFSKYDNAECFLFSLHLLETPQTDRDSCWLLYDKTQNTNTMRILPPTRTLQIWGQLSRIITVSGTLAFPLILLLENGSKKQIQPVLHTFKIQHEEDLPTILLEQLEASWPLWRNWCPGTLWALGKQSFLQTIKNGDEQLCEW